MNRGFYLTLMMGPFTASPVSQAVIEALTEVQVSSAVGSQGGFQLKFGVGKTSPIQQMMAGGKFDPRQRVIIAVTVNGSTEVLMDGVITKLDYTPSSAAGKSTLTVTGLDLTVLMDFIDFTGIPYPALPSFLIVEAILAKYSVLGIIPVALPSPIPVINNPLEKFIKQNGTDYAFINELGGGQGAVFYLDPGPQPGASTAYWVPDISKLFGGAQPAMSINFDGSTNMDSLSFSYDGTLATQYLVTIIEPNTKLLIPIPVPSLEILMPPLGAQTPPIMKIRQLTPSASKDPTEAAVNALGKVFETPDVLTASGQLDVLRYGQVFKAHQLAAVRGAGAYYDGNYYVKSVTHNIKRGEYKQSFTLARGGIGSTVSTVGV